MWDVLYIRCAFKCAYQMEHHFVFAPRAQTELNPICEWAQTVTLRNKKAGNAQSTLTQVRIFGW